LIIQVWAFFFNRFIFVYENPFISSRKPENMLWSHQLQQRFLVGNLILIVDTFGRSTLKTPISFQIFSRLPMEIGIPIWYINVSCVLIIRYIDKNKWFNKYNDSVISILVMTTLLPFFFRWKNWKPGGNCLEQYCHQVP